MAEQEPVVLVPPVPPAAVEPPPPPARLAMTMTEDQLAAHVQRAADQAATSALERAEASRLARENAARVELEAARVEQNRQKERPMPEPVVTTPPAPQADPVAALKAEMDAKLAEMSAAIKAANDRADASDKEKAKAIARLRRAKADLTEAEIQSQATAAGMVDPAYASTLYGRATSAALEKKNDKGEPAPDPVPDPVAFFAALRTSHPHLVKGAPPANTTPIPSGPSNREPAPAPAGGGVTPENNAVDKMDDREFGEHSRSKYNFSPSRAS